MSPGPDRRRAAPTLLLLGALVLPACCPEVQRVDAAVGGSGGTADGGSAAVAARFGAIQRQLFDRHCVADCHETLNPGAGLRLTPDRSYDDLVNAASQQVTTLVRVLPGQPDRSYLVRKLEGGAGIVGSRMPRLAPPRPDEEIAQVRAWISRGAADD